METPLHLRPVDRAEVTVLVDNFTDVFLPDGHFARRPVRPWDPAPGVLRAEHGLSLLLSIEAGGSRSSVLYDAGLGRDTAVHNMDVLGLRVPDLRAIVLSHGHVDHFTGLEGLARRLGARGLPLVLHPDARNDRKIVFPSGEVLLMPPPRVADLEADGIKVIDDRGPSLLIDGAVLVTGQVERHTGFETGFPLQYALRDGEWTPDFEVWDDQAVVVNVSGQGLLVLSGCSHAGIVNIVEQAKRLTGVDRVYGVIGGFHLTGPMFEPRVGPTVDELVRLAPAMLAPGHCTGWRGIHEIARRLPGAFVQTSVGTRFEFEAATRAHAAQGEHLMQVR